MLFMIQLPTILLSFPEGIVADWAAEGKQAVRERGSEFRQRERLQCRQLGADYRQGGKIMSRFGCCLIGGMVLVLAPSALRVNAADNVL